MPTYRYRCDRCGEQIDVWQSIHDEALRVHEGECGGALLKVLGVGGIVLKGSGFYRNDSGARSKGRNGDRSKSDKSDGNGSSEKGGTKKSDDKKADTSSSKADSSSSKSDSSSSK